MAAILVDSIESMFEGNAYDQILFIIVLSLIIQLGINLFFSMVFFRPHYAMAFIVVVIAEGILVITLFLLSWYFIGLQYNYIISGLTLYEIVLNSGYLFLYYCVYVLPNPEWIGIISEGLFCIYFIIFSSLLIKIEIKKKSEASEEKLFRPGYKL